VGDGVHHFAHRRHLGLALEDAFAFLTLSDLFEDPFFEHFLALRAVGPAAFDQRFDLLAQFGGAPLCFGQNVFDKGGGGFRFHDIPVFLFLSIIYSALRIKQG